MFLAAEIVEIVLIDQALNPGNIYYLAKSEETPQKTVWILRRLENSQENF